MVGRLLLIFIFAIIPVYRALALNCNKNETECKATPGCLWENGCRQCDMQENYCEGGVPKPCPTNFPNSDTGAASVMFCYKTVTCDNNGASVNNCKYYQGDFSNGLNIVFQPSDTDTPTAHIEGGLNGTCYTNTRKCKNFNSTGCNTTNVTGDAIYLPEPDMQKWSVQNCTCKEQNVHYTEKNCIATKNYTASGTVANVGNTINYTVSNYYCTGCIGGHYVKPENVTAQQYCQGSSNPCSCSPVAQGYYMPECTWGTSWTNQCTQPSPCPAGQTTGGPGSAEPGACHFTSETQFCDAGGCFTLGDIENQYGIGPSDWEE